MPERSIHELLGELPRPIDPDPAFDARLRAHLAAELRADIADPTPNPNRPTPTEVIELQTIERPNTSSGSPKPQRRWWQAAAAVVLIGGVAATAFAITRDESSTTTVPEPNPTTAPEPDPTTAPEPAPTTTLAEPTTTIATVDTTFVGATTETFAIDLPYLPYFVAAHDAPWVVTLSGELVRVDPQSGAPVQRAKTSEASMIAADSDALWVADARTGNVVRLDPLTGEVVATIATGVEIALNIFRVPMLYGEARAFAHIGGIVSTGDTVWAGDRTGGVFQIDPATNTIVQRIEVPVRADNLSVDGGLLVVSDRIGGDIAVLDMATGEIVYLVDGLDDLVGAALYGGALYTQNGVDGTVTRTDLATGDEITSAALGPSLVFDHTPELPTGLVASGAGVLVVTDSGDASLHVLDPVTLAETGTLPVASDNGEMSIAADGSVWLVRKSASAVVHIVPAEL